MWLCDPATNRQNLQGISHLWPIVSGKGSGDPVTPNSIQWVKKSREPLGPWAFWKWCCGEMHNSLFKGMQDGRTLSMSLRSLQMISGWKSESPSFFIYPREQSIQVLNASIKWVSEMSLWFFFSPLAFSISLHTAPVVMTKKKVFTHFESSLKANSEQLCLTTEAILSAREQTKSDWTEWKTWNFCFFYFLLWKLKIFPQLFILKMKHNVAVGH